MKSNKERLHLMQRIWLKPIGNAARAKRGDAKPIADKITEISRKYFKTAHHGKFEITSMFQAGDFSMFKAYFTEQEILDENEMMKTFELIKGNLERRKDITLRQLKDIHAILMTDGERDFLMRKRIDGLFPKYSLRSLEMDWCVMFENQTGIEVAYTDEVTDEISFASMVRSNIDWHLSHCKEMNQIILRNSENYLKA